MEKAIVKLRLKHVKVLQKTIVVKKGVNTLYISTDRHFEPSLLIDQIEVWAQKIEKAERAIKKEEVTELVALFEATGYVAIDWKNLIVAKDGIYIIDTEFINFWLEENAFRQGAQYQKMAMIVGGLPQEEQEKFLAELQTKYIAYRENEDQLNSERSEREAQEEVIREKQGARAGSVFTFQLTDLL